MLLGRRGRIWLRALAGLVVVAWLASRDVRGWVPVWLPFAILLAAEAEYALRGLLELRRGPAARPRGGVRGAPDERDADLGWGELVEELDEQGAPIVRWVPPPPRPPRRRLGVLRLAALVAVGAILLVAYRVDRDASWSSLGRDAQAATEARLTREAARVAGRPVRVACDDGYAYTGLGSDALGVAFPTRGLAYLRPAVCRTLHDALRGDRPETDDAAEAVLVLAHEAVHLRGERREGVTECLALQDGVAVAARLGWSRPAAVRLMRRRYDAALADRSITRLTYALPPGCRDGGALDRRPDDAAFP